VDFEVPAAALVDVVDALDVELAAEVVELERESALDTAAFRWRVPPLTMNIWELLPQVE